MSQMKLLAATFILVVFSVDLESRKIVATAGPRIYIVQAKPAEDGLLRRFYDDLTEWRPVTIEVKGEQRGDIIQAETIRGGVGRAAVRP